MGFFLILFLMVGILNHQGNANSSYFEIQSQPNHNDCHQENKGQQILEEMWKKGLRHCWNERRGLQPPWKSGWHWLQNKSNKQSKPIRIYLPWEQWRLLMHVWTELRVPTLSAYMSTYCCSSHNNKGVKAAEMSITRWLGNNFIPP